MTEGSVNAPPHSCHATSAAVFPDTVLPRRRAISAAVIHVHPALNLSSSCRRDTTRRLTLRAAPRRHRTTSAAVSYVSLYRAAAPPLLLSSLFSSPLALSCSHAQVFGVKLLSQRAPIRYLDGAIDVPSYVTFEATAHPQMFLLFTVAIVQGGSDPCGRKARRFLVAVPNESP